MEFKSEQKYARISPTKVRPLVSDIKSMEIEKALEVLPLIPKKGASFLLKVVKSAVANAVNKGFSISDLEFKEIVVNEGPRFKRGRPVSRGMWHPYVRMNSHIRVVLQLKEKSEKSLEEVKKETNKNEGEGKAVLVKDKNVVVGQEDKIVRAKRIKKVVKTKKTKVTRK